MNIVTAVAPPRIPLIRGLGIAGTHVVAAVERERRTRRHSPRERDDRAHDLGTYQLGLLAEHAAADALRSDGWRIIGHRVKTKVGELDVIARRRDVIAFVEVKSRGPNSIEPTRAVAARQQMRIRRAAVAWIGANPREQRGVRRYRFDVQLMIRDASGTITGVEHIEDAF